MDWNGQPIFSMQVASLYRLHCVNNYMQAFVYVCMYIHIEAYLLIVLKLSMMISSFCVMCIFSASGVQWYIGLCAYLSI